MGLLGESEDGLGRELSEYLQSMVSDGAVNSSGVFTIDVRAALPKLEKFQLPRPHFGILKVIQSAIASSASRVETRFTSTGIVIEHDGFPPRGEELTNLFSFLLSPTQSAADRALRDLAVGLNTSLARGAAWVEIAARSESGWIRQRWASRDESSQLEEPNDARRATVRFVLRNSASQVASGVWGVLAKKDIYGMLAGRRDELSEDAQAVFDRCRYAPAAIRINGRTVPPASLGQTIIRRWSLFTWAEHRRGNLAEFYLQASEESPYLMSAPQASQARYRYYLPGTFDGLGFQSTATAFPVDGPMPARRLFAVIGLRGKSNVPGEMIVVKDGVELTRLTPPSFPKGVSVVVVAEGLRLDLSQFRLVEALETEARLLWLQQMVALAAHHVLENATELYPAEAKYLQQLGSGHQPLEGRAGE